VGSFQGEAAHFRELNSGVDGLVSKFGCGGFGIARLGLRAKIPGHGSNFLCPCSITISAITLAILEADRDPSGEGFSFRHIALSLFHAGKKPIVWAPLLGLVFSCAGSQLPSYVDRSLAVMGSASAGSALVLTGLVVSAQKFEFGGNTLVAFFLKNLLQPGLALGIAMLLHLSLSRARYVTLISAIPCGFFRIVFGKSFDAGPKLASSGLITSYVLGVTTLAVWIVVVNHLG
jgi:predicted permease